MYLVAEKDKICTVCEMKTKTYEFLDCGDGKRYERFGDWVVERPCPQAVWSPEGEAIKTDARFIRNGAGNEWQKINPDMPDVWEMQVHENIQAELKLSANGQVGIFAEHAQTWDWVRAKVMEHKGRELNILNGFGYTGMATLHASADHTTVCHVDGAKSAVSWARRNAEISAMGDNKIRWICDDVLDFMAREVKRGKKYDGIILDPPAFGRGGGKDWKLERDLPEMLSLMGKLLVDDPAFVVLTCHAPEHYIPEDIADMLADIPQCRGKHIETIELELTSRDGRRVPMSFGARVG